MANTSYKLTTPRGETLNANDSDDDKVGADKIKLRQNQIDLTGHVK